MLRHLVNCLLVLLACCLPVTAQDIVEYICSDVITFSNSEGSVVVPYCSNRDFDSYNTDITQAVIVVHGTLRNAIEYYQSVWQSATASGNADSLLVVAPQFLTEQDYQYWDPGEEHIFWEYMGWRQGDQSFDNLHYPRAMELSAYEVADLIMDQLVSRNPNLRQIVVTGHSAGGQFVNRLMAASTMPDFLQRTYGILVRGVVANPSSYVYFSPERWVENSAYEFAVPSPQDIAECYDYNYYKYGLEYPNPYMSVDAGVLVDRYASHEVVYLVGYLDYMWDLYLDISCSARLQGEARRQRGNIYWAYLQDFYGPVITARHNRFVVPNVGHDNFGIYNSVFGREAIFGARLLAQPEWSWADTSPSLISGNCGNSVSWIDYDNDNNLDLYIAGTGDTNQLLRNHGAGNFTDVTTGPLADSGDGKGSVWGDYDNDGDADIYLVNTGSDNKLLRNDDGGVFADVTDVLLAADGTVADATWVDHDQDNDLDLYLIRSDGNANSLLRNDDGTFSDVTTPLLAGSGDSYCAVWGDYDNDRDLDVFIANDGASRLLKNEGDGTFTDASAVLANLTDSHCAAAWGDFNNDSRLDLFICGSSGSHGLFFNRGGGEFNDRSNLVNTLAYQFTGVALADYDNDGWLDILLACEFVNRLLFNPGFNRGFVDVSVDPVSDNANTRGAAWGDYDNDGDLDLLFANSNRSNRLVCNSGQGNNYFQVKVMGDSSSLGARVRVVTAMTEQIRQVGGDCGPLGRNASVVSFGIGAATRVDSLEVDWIGGGSVLRTDLFAGQQLVVFEDTLGVPGEPGIPDVPDAFSLRQNIPNPFNPGTTIHFDIPRTQFAELAVFSLTGHRVATLVNEVVEARSYAIHWDGCDTRGHSMASGVYFYRLRTGEFVETRRMTLVR